MNDDEILQKLELIDSDEDVTVSNWEADFLNTVLKSRRLSDRQRRVSLQMIEKYSH